MAKSNTRLWIGLIGLTLCMCACRHSKDSITQVRDSDLVFQVKQINNEQGDPHTIDYAVRLIPNKKLLADKGDAFKTSLWYSMDSCFYVLHGQKKVYSAIVQPIANGVAGSFEYMLSFEEDDLKTGNWNLIYEDKCLNHKKYTLNLNKE